MKVELLYEDFWDVAGEEEALEEIDRIGCQRAVKSFKM